MSAPKPAPYTAEELLGMLKDRQGGQSQKAFSQELGISEQFLSQIYRGDRSVGNEKILEYLAPTGRKFVHQDVWVLMDK